MSWSISPENPELYVVVTNISLNATEKSVQDFFGFCGKIRHFELTRGESNQSSLIGFEKPTSVRTALMLTNAVISDEAIIVNMFEPQVVKSAPDDSVPIAAGENIDTMHKPVSIFAEVMAAGYLVSESIVKSAKNIDEKLGISTKVKDVGENVNKALKPQVAKIDEKLHVTEATKDVSNQINKFANNVDQKLHVKENWDKALNSEPGKVVSSFFGAVQGAVKNLHDETMRAVAEKKNATPKQSPTKAKEEEDGREEVEKLFDNERIE